MSLSVQVALAALLVTVPLSRQALTQGPSPEVRSTTSPPTADQPQVEFSFDRPGLPVPQFKITLNGDSTGVYEGRQVSGEAGATLAVSAEPFRRSMTLSPQTTEKVLSLATQTGRFQANCGTRLKNVADTGRKTLSYRSAEGAGSCTYNYSDNKNVTELTIIFLGVAATMDEGRRLEHLHRYDRLGLDAELGSLAEQVTGGHALELVTIQSTLRSIADDVDLMQRARKRADSLLAMIPTQTQKAGP